jgi:hypothetical protein
MEKEELHYIANKAYADKLKNRIEVLESALKKVALISLKRADYDKIDKIITKALWPV